MKQLRFTQLHKLPLLHDQLIAAGIMPQVVERNGSEIILTVADDVSEAAVQAIVTAHDPSVLSLAEQADAERSTAQSEMRTQYAAALTRLDEIVANAATLTAVQVKDAVVDLARIQRRLLKLVRMALT